MTDQQKSRQLRSFSALLSTVVLLAFSAQAAASGIGNAGDDMRTGWYPDESALTPGLVSGGTFGQLWSASVDGQVYAQPLLSNGTLVVATENDEVYGLDPATGAQQWNRDLGPPWNPSDIGCADIQPKIGTTATPVIDPTTNTVYLTRKTYVSGTSGPAVWYMEALDVTTGAERPGFPVALSGTAQNDPAAAFLATDQQQRPGLLLMNGVVYAAFGSHCDYSTWQGWVFGVSSAGHVVARWVDNLPGSSGAGIWQAGVGLMSDEPGSILLSTGNGGAPTTPTPGDQPPSTFGESVVRLQVQPDGSLQPVDFFAPFDAQSLDFYDADFGSGGVVGLPDTYFGTPTIPHLAVMVGKEGYVYLLNRDSLGGFDQGSGGGDSVVQRIGPRGGVWGRAGVWPGDGGYVYLTTASGGNGGGPLDVYKYGVTGGGLPALSLVGSSPDVFGWGSGPAVITSDGTTSGSALVWVVWSANRSGNGGQLRAYDPIPVDGQPVLRWSAPIGNATNYSTPGVGAGRLYVGTRDGKVLAFGSPVIQPLSSPGVSFPTTTVGTTSQETMTLTANGTVTLQTLSSTSGQFTIGTPSQALPATLTAGQTISVPLTFAPTSYGPLGGELNAGVSGGSTIAVSLTGTGQAAPGLLSASPPVVSLGGTAVGGELTGTATFSNVGGKALTINAVALPSAPFSATGAPSVGDTIAPGSSITVNVAFDPTSLGEFSDSIGLETTGGNETVGITGSAGTPGTLQINSATNDFGTVTIGTSATRTFTITNTGGTTVEITKSKPPFGGEFTALTSLSEGATIAPGATVTEQVSFAPTTPGYASSNWEINGNGTTGSQDVQFSGAGVPAAAAASAGAGPAASASNGAPIGGVGEIDRALTAAPAVETVQALRGAHVTYIASAVGTTKLTLQRKIQGRRIGGACVKATRRNRRHAGCVRYVTIATLLHADVVGLNRIGIAAIVGHGRLSSGLYRLCATPIYAAGAGPTVYTPLRVLARAGVSASSFIGIESPLWLVFGA